MNINYSPGIMGPRVSGLSFACKKHSAFRPPTFRVSPLTDTPAKVLCIFDNRRRSAEFNKHPSCNYPLRNDNYSNDLGMTIEPRRGRTI
jgi:hypothetical protein